MNQQSCQKALLKCSKINKRRHKDESKVKRLLSRLLKELPMVVSGGSQQGVGSGSQAHQVDAHVPRGSLYDSNRINNMHQDLKCDLSQRFTERHQPSDHRAQESPTKQQLLYKGGSSGGGLGGRDHQKRQSRKDVDCLLQHIWRSHQNAVKMEKSVSRAIELHKKTPADDSPCHTIVSQSEQARFRDCSVNNNTMKGQQSAGIDDIRLNQILQQWPHNKQAEQYDTNNLEEARFRYGQGGQIQITENQAIDYQRIGSAATAADLSRMLPQTGVKCLNNLRQPPPPSVAPRYIQQQPSTSMEKTATVAEPNGGQQSLHTQMIATAAKNTSNQQQLLITNIKLPPRTLLNQHTNDLGSNFKQQEQLSPQPFLEGEIGATDNQPNQLGNRKPLLTHRVQPQPQTNASALEESPLKQQNTTRNQQQERRQRGRPRKNLNPLDELQKRSKVSRQGSIRGSQRGQLQRQQSVSSMMRQDEDESILSKKTPHFKHIKRLEQDDEDSKMENDDEEEFEEEQTIERTEQNVKTEVAQDAHTDVVTLAQQADTIQKKAYQADIAPKAQEFSKPAEPLTLKQGLTDDTTRPTDKQDSEERQQCSKEPIQSELHQNSAGPESEDEEEDESEESSSSEEDVKKPYVPKRGTAEKGLFKPSVGKSSYMQKRQDSQTNTQTQGQAIPQISNFEMTQTNRESQQFSNFEEQKNASHQQTQKQIEVSKCTFNGNGLQKQSSIELSNQSRARTYELPAISYQEVGVGGIIDQTTIKRQGGGDFERDRNNLTPVPTFIENPEIMLGGAQLDAYSSLRWNNGLPNFDIPEGDGLYGAGFGGFLQQRALGENNYGGGIDNYDNFAQYNPAPAISPRPSPALGSSTALPYKSLGANPFNMNYGAPAPSRLSFMGGNGFPTLQGLTPIQSELSSNRQYIIANEVYHQQNTAAFGHHMDMIDEAVSPGDLNQKNPLDSQGE